jgi:hypothetical protein
VSIGPQSFDRRLQDGTLADEVRRCGLGTRTFPYFLFRPMRRHANKLHRHEAAVGRVRLWHAPDAGVRSSWAGHTQAQRRRAVRRSCCPEAQLGARGTHYPLKTASPGRAVVDTRPGRVGERTTSPVDIPLVPSSPSPPQRQPPPAELRRRGNAAMTLRRHAQYSFVGH